MREKKPVQVQFLLGPAGSGKTFRCLAEIRAELLRAPDGPPLVLLAPKQATFQLERQLLADAALPGYARLQIFSFERLARHVLDEFRLAPAPSLSDEGRVMVLRALLQRHAGELQRFQHSARRTGFAQLLSALLAEFQSHQLPPEKIHALAQRGKVPDELQAKLHDLGLLAQAYADWLRAHELQDANHLLDAATRALRREPESRGRASENNSPNSGSHLLASGLWLDGFAEMTPAELDLLVAVLPYCERATLAFCLDHEPAGDESWLSIWAVVGKTFQRCRDRVAGVQGVRANLEWLPRDAGKGRFANNRALAHLERQWAQSQPKPGDRSAGDAGAPSLVACASPEAEAALAAREILKFVRGGGRFREVAVLVRSLDGYHKPLARAFRRYGIPFFLDRREGVAHHPLAELTRSALRTVAFDWQHEDWFAALKAGFCAVEETEIDRLENEALARGWRGAKWRSPLLFPESEAELGRQLEQLRVKILPPFAELAERLAKLRLKPTGAELAEILRAFWSAMKAGERLEAWAEESASRSVHATVFTQMNAWLENVALAFAHEALPLREWLPVLEAGLANLTVGVIPPALDQVLIGAIDRARNPDLRLAFVLGLNEGIFPAAPGAPPILSETDRDELESRGVVLGPNLYDRLANERYYGYIACTRSSERLVLTWSEQDADGRKLNPSPFVSHLRRLFPEIASARFVPAAWPDAEHVSELAKALLEIRNPEPSTRNWTALQEIPAVRELAASLSALHNPELNAALAPSLAEKLYGQTLKTSVSRLEQFASCPFRFFVHSGMRAEERKVFELDFREQGSFQHDVLQAFHEQLSREGKRWRDITTADARARIGRIAQELMANYREGLLRDSPQTVFTAQVLTRSLQDFIEVLVGWMHTRYQFDPAAVELEFSDAGNVPAWKLDLGGGRQLLLRGRIDRVDLHRPPGAEAALGVVIDYKSSQKKLDPLLLENGVQLQLLSYLNVLQQWPAPQALLGVSRIVPAGVFYVNLRARPAAGDSRAALGDATAARKEAYRHTGRFNAEVLRQLDASGAAVGEQFKFRLKKDGTLDARSTEVLSTQEFGQLLARVESQLRAMGERIFAGEASVDPYRKGTSTPCEFCDYAAVCRIDPWTHEYRVLRRAGAVADEADEN